MGKVKDEAPAKTAKTAPKGSAFRRAGALAFRSLPTSSRRTHLSRRRERMPGSGRRSVLAFWLGLGLYQFYETQLKDQIQSLPLSYGIPAGLAVLFAWTIWRLVQYPPFADFLIATEAEMNKVSWTSRDDLYRATIVVLAMVLFLALYLFGVDYVWSTLLKAIGVLKMNSRSLGDSG